MKISYNSKYGINDYLRCILSEIKNPVIFEIGAHNFRSGKKILNYCKGNFVYHGFEPDSRQNPSLRPSSKININRVAISNFDGYAPFYLSGGYTTAASSLKTPNKLFLDFRPTLEFNDTITVKVMKLDTYCLDKVDHIDFMWVDAQGSEYEIILGAQNILKNTKFIFMEYSHLLLYKNQFSLDCMLSALPGEWELIHKFQREIVGDVLLQNKGINYET